MKLANALAHRALLFVAAVETHGYRPTADELEIYMTAEDRDPGKPPTAGRRVLASETLLRFAEAMRAAVEGMTVELPGDPGRPPEGFAAWLTRLRWLEDREGRLSTTALGRAVFSHLQRADLEAEIPVQVVLDPSDELASARVIAHIADLGSCALIDPYFSMESLLPILHSTEVEAVLTSERGAKSRIAGLEVALGGLQLPREFEVRTSDAFHDRYVIPVAGAIWMIGTSLGGVGKRFSVMVKLEDAEPVRRQFRAAWEAASRLRPVGPMGDEEDGEASKEST